MKQSKRRSAKWSHCAAREKCLKDKIVTKQNELAALTDVQKDFAQSRRLNEIKDTGRSRGAGAKVGGKAAISNAETSALGGLFPQRQIKRGRPIGRPE